MDPRTKAFAVVLVVAALVVGATGYMLLTGKKEVLRLATTTSTYDSGLLDYILPEFEKRRDCEIDVVAVGSGQAMEMGKRGDVDILLVHSPTDEIAFVSGGYGESRDLVMYNSFVLVGPLADPADLNHSANVSAAFQKVHDNGTAGVVEFVSRGDGSGTQSKELSIWEELGLNATDFSSEWYISPGAGMGAVLDMCEQIDAYTLSDDATYYQRQSEQLIPSLKIAYNHLKTDSTLKNQYSVIVLNETRFPHIDHGLATSFKDWLVSQEGQDLIASYERYGHQLFIPNAAGHIPSASSLTPTAPVPIGEADADEHWIPGMASDARRAAAGCGSRW